MALRKQGLKGSPWRILKAAAFGVRNERGVRLGCCWETDEGERAKGKGRTHQHQLASGPRGSLY